MIDLSEEIQAFEEAVYGKDVRAAMVNGAEKIQNEVNDAIEHQLVEVDDTLTIEGAGADAKVVGAYLNTTQIVATEQDPKDYNEITTPGKYFNGTQVSVSYTSHKPDELTSPHKLYVIEHTSKARISQIILANITDPGVRIYKRFGSRSGSAPNYTWSWGPWNEILDSVGGIDTTLTQASKAADAQVVGTKIDEINAVNEKVSVYCEGAYSYYGLRPYVIAGTGQWTTSTGRHISINVKPGDVITIVGNRKYTSYCGFLKSDNAGSNVNIDYCANTSSATWAERKEIPSNEGVTYVAPSDCNILCVTAYVATKLDMLPSKIIINGTDYAFGLREETEEIFVDLYGVLKYYNPLPYIITGTDTFTWTTSTGRHLSINVKPESVITLTANSDYPTYCAFLKSDNYKPNETPDFCDDTETIVWQERKSIDAGATVEFTAPKDCHILYLTVYSSTLLNQLPSKIVIDGINYTYDLRARVDELSEYSGDRNWSHKKWACVGDSITAENTKTSIHYHDYIHEETGITVVNMGISGTGYKRHEDSNRAFYQRVLNVPLDSDVITLFGSVNDVQNYETFGNVTDTTTDTVCGCINVALDNIFSILPAAPVGIIAPIPGWVSDEPTLFERMEEYVDKMRQICEKRCVPFLDLFHSSNLHPWDAACRASTFSHDGGGGIHPDETGHKLIAGRVRVFLDSLMG